MAALWPAARRGVEGRKGKGREGDGGEADGTEGRGHRDAAARDVRKRVIDAKVCEDVALRDGAKGAVAGEASGEVEEDEQAGRRACGGHSTAASQPRLATAQAEGESARESTGGSGGRGGGEEGTCLSCLRGQTAPEGAESWY